MARIRGRAGYKPKTYNKPKVFQWLKALPEAPEFHPTPEEFQDPIAYIHKIEKEASSYGICKIVPPLPLPSRKTTFLELNKSFLALKDDALDGSSSSKGEPTPAFTTRVQQVGFSPRKDLHVIKSVRESGESYTISEFEEKAKAFEKNYFKNSSIMKGVLSPLELETLYWDAQADKAIIDVEYGNDMPGSAFVELDKRRSGENLNVGDTEWNVRGATRAQGCPLRFVKDDIPGVTSPMVYIGMMFSWFAWHVEDHDFHSLDYLHMGDAKTWYGVPSDAALAFEEEIRKCGYEGQRNYISTCATLAQKTTVMSPEVILNAGIPCCRLVQNAGEFVVTFPRAYHSGFCHGFNCAEASNIATPEWLKFARKAALWRSSINFPQLISHNQLLYNLALSSPSRVPMSVEPRSLRLEESKKRDGEYLVKDLFLQDVVHNTKLLHILGKGSQPILLPRDFVEGNFPKLHDGNFSCVTCGVLCFACAAIIRPSEVAAHNLMLTDSGKIEGKAVASEVRDGDANNVALDSSLGRNTERPPKHPSSLALIALTYGDAIDFETDEDSTKSHVFCLEHAFEVEQKLCAVGGGHVLLLCHPDYPKFQAEAKVVADDLGAAHLLNNIDFKTATTEDRESFIYALNSEGLTHGYADWTVTLGVNLFHSAELGRSTNYSKQIPDNSVLYKAFGHGPSADISAKTKLVQKRSVVAGKWCGKVWMSDQIHDLLAEGVHDEQDLSQTLAKQQVPEPEVMPENPKKRQTVDFSSKSSRSALKRKRMADSESTSRIEYPEIVESVKDAPRGKCDIQYQRRHKLKKKVTQEKSLQPEKDLDQGRKQFNVNMEEKLEEGGPSTRLRPRTGKQPTKDPKLVMDKAIGRSATEKRTCSERAKSTRETQASTVRRTKKSDEPEYACKTEGCSMTFGSKRELVLHNKNICSVEGCGKKFVSHKYLLQHKRVHLDDRPLKCSWVGCSKTFKWAWALTEHMRIHTGERPYVCGETGCGKKFRFVSDFSRHKRITRHSGETSRQRKARS